MAANSTLLAIQCATGVPVPRCHLRRNLVTKTHNPIFKVANPAVQYEAAALFSSPSQLHRNLVSKTHNPIFKVANPAVQYEAAALLSSPSQLHRNLVSKRDKTITAAFPINIQYTTDNIPGYTKIIIENFSGEDLKLEDMAKSIWEGARFRVFPEEIKSQGRHKFEHVATNATVKGSVVGLQYLFGKGDKFKWIIAWSNKKNEVNKVYTQILKEKVVDWDEIKDKLDKSGQHDVDEKLPYSSDIVINPTSSTPTVKATLKLILFDGVKPASKA